MNKARWEDGELRVVLTRDIGRERAGISAVADRVLLERWIRDPFALAVPVI